VSLTRLGPRMLSRFLARRARRESGFALAVVLVIVVLGATALALRTINAASLRSDRYRVTQEALIKAKEALIAYAVSDTARPGELPCPDVNDDGKLMLGEDFVGSNCVSLIGRLPWRTLDLPDLRDAQGERLWYALSNDFHANGPVALNSDTAYRPGNTSLSISGTQVAGNVVAIVFSAGTTLKRAGAAALQDRSCIVGTDCDATYKCTTSPASNTPKCNPAGYLDVSGVDNADGDTTFVSAAESETFNDRMLPILSDEIMSLVERRVGRELGQKLRDHFDAWQCNAPCVPPVNIVNRKGFYPWAAPFNDPTVASPGVSGTLNGQLPIGAASVVWTSALTVPPSPVLTCAGLGSSSISCTGDPGVVAVSITGQVDNIATAFVDPPGGTEVTVVSGVVLIPPTVTWTLDQANQRLNFSWNGLVLGAPGKVEIQVRAPAASAWTASWLTANNWHQLSYYALSPGYAINGTNSCVPGTNCVSVANAIAPNNDKQAVIVTSGRTLTGTLPPQAARPVAPPASEADFLEGGNQTPADLAFEQNMRSPAFNDQPAVVRP